ncbi:hypothetical protein VTK56DRAFT_2092 [Thermocarpiscus australiensis]
MSGPKCKNAAVANLQARHSTDASGSSASTTSSPGVNPNQQGDTTNAGLTEKRVDEGFGKTGPPVVTRQKKVRLEPGQLADEVDIKLPMADPETVHFEFRHDEPRFLEAIRHRYYRYAPVASRTGTTAYRVKFSLSRRSGNAMLNTLPELCGAHDTQ